MKTTVTHAWWRGRDTLFPGYLGTLEDKVMRNQMGWLRGLGRLAEVPNESFEAGLMFSHFEARNHSSVAWFTIYQPGHWGGDTSGDPEWRVTGGGVHHLQISGGPAAGCQVADW